MILKIIATIFYIIKKLIIESHNVNNQFKFPYEIFTYSNIKNNLVYLELKFHVYPKIENKFGKIFENLKNLEELRLDSFSTFDFGKSNIKYLYLSNGNNVSFTENIYPNLQIIDVFMINSLNKHLLQLNIPKITIPALLKFRISFCFQKYGDIFDFNSCTKLKYFIRLNLYYFFSIRRNIIRKSISK